MHILPKYISTHFFNNCCQNVSITTKRIKELYSEFIKLILISLPTLCVWIKKTNFLLARPTNLCFFYIVFAICILKKCVNAQKYFYAKVNA